MLALLTLLVAFPVDEPKPADTKPLTPREALKPFNVLVGSWKGTGAPEGTREEKAAGLWTETATWGWGFLDDDAWVTVSFDKSKHFTDGILRYNAAKGNYQLTLTTTEKKKVSYSGTLKEKVLTLDRTDAPAGEESRLVFSLLHHNRHLYRFETKSAGAFTKMWQVGATKEGVPFADVAKGPECVVSGGVGTSKVMYKGKEYYVCCTGCRDAFKDNPEKWIKEYEAKLAKEKK
ncbi:MAG: YHS domain-containing protein [Gemmataceae bacterium]